MTRFGDEQVDRRRLIHVLDSDGYPVTMIVTRYGYGKTTWVGVSLDATMRHTVLFPVQTADDVCEAIRKAAA